MQLDKTSKPWIPKRQKVNKSWSYDSRYHTARWRNYRKSFLMDNPICIECKKVDKIIPSKVVDHIKPVSADSSDENFWNQMNHQALCKSCNNRKAKKDAIHKR